MLCSPSAFDRIPVLGLDGQNTGTQSHRRDSGSFFIKVYSDASPEVSQAISPTDFPLTRFQFYFPCHLFRLASIPLPLSSSDGFASHPICPPANMREPLSLGERKCSIQFPNLILALREMVPFLLSLTHVHTHTHTHTHIHTHKIHPCVKHGYEEVSTWLNRLCDAESDRQDFATNTLGYCPSNAFYSSLSCSLHQYHV